MRARTLAGLFMAMMALTLAPHRVHAGGWASVVLDAPLTEARAGEEVRIGFMVKQHGVTPIDSPSGAGPVMKPMLTATRADTSELVSAEAVKEGPTGHFVVAVTFPIAGRWEWEITPAPFAGTKFPSLKVMPPGLGASAADERSLAPAPAQAAAERHEGGAVRNGLGIGLLLLALAAAIVTARGGFPLPRIRTR